MFELIQVQSKVRDAASKQIVKHVESKMEAEKLAYQYKVDLSKEQLARKLAEAKVVRMENRLDKCQKEVHEEESKNKVLEEGLARERSRCARMRKEIHNEWKRSNELRDELYKCFSDIEKLQSVVGDEVDRRITAERNAVNLKRQFEEEIDHRKFVEKIYAKEKYRADGLDKELQNILHNYADFEKFMIARGAKVVAERKRKVTSMQRKSCALEKCVDRKPAINANETPTSQVSSENLPALKDKQTETFDFFLEKLNSSLPELQDKQTEISSADFLLEEQQNTSDLEFMVAEETEKRQKVEKKVLELQKIIENTEDTQMEIKILKDLCQEEAQLRGDLQADALKKNLRIEQLKMKIKMLDAEKNDVLENVHMMGAYHEHGHFKEETANHMEAVVMEEIEKRNEMEKKVKELEFLLEGKPEKADGETSKDLPKEGIMKKYFEGDYLDKKFKTMLEEQIRETEFVRKETKEMTLGQQTKKAQRIGVECGADNMDDLNAVSDGMEIICDGETAKKVKVLPLKEDKETSTTDLFIQQQQQRENKLQQMLAEEIEKRTKVEKNFFELEMTVADDKLDIVTEIKVSRDLYEKEAKLRRDLEADGSEKKLMIEELRMKIECIESEKKEAIENSNKAQNKYFLQTAGNDELLAMLAEEMEKRVEVEKKVEHLEKLLGSMEKKRVTPEQNAKLGRFKMFEILLKNELERGKGIERMDGEVAMTLKLEDNASGDFKRNISVKKCLEDKEEKRPLKKDKGTETSEHFALLTDEIEKRKKAEKKVLELQMIMNDDEKIDTAMEMQVLRDACEEEAKLRRDFEADALKKKLQIEELKMKLKVFDAEKADFKANMH